MKMLVVASDSTSRSMLESMLAKWGYEVVVAGRLSFHGALGIPEWT
jgi:CheY-like chemotaxis protein